MKKLKSNPYRIKPAAARLKAGDSWRVDKSSTARGYGYRWQCERAEFLLLNPFCRMCRERGVITAACVVDHVIPHNGNAVLFWDWNNWQGLCTHCHSAHKQRAEHAERFNAS